MGLLKTKALIKRVAEATPAEAQGPAIPAGPYRGRVVEASNAKGNDQNIYMRFELFPMADVECKGTSVRKVGKVFDLANDQYGDNEASDFMALLVALRLEAKAETLEASDLVGGSLIVGVESLGRKDGGLFNVIARGGYWDAENNSVDFEPRDEGANRASQGQNPYGRGRF